MCASFRARAILATLSFFALCGASGAGGLARSKHPATAGQKLFERVWEPITEAHARGDGLGPLFNERSCVACHFQGGVGGAGPISKNVILLTVAPPPRKPAATGANAPKEEPKPAPIVPAGLHRGFRDAGTIVLHRYSTRGDAYQTFLDNLIGLDPADAIDPLRKAGLKRVATHRDGEGPGRVVEVDGTLLQISERNTPALFGAGLISLIRKAEIKEVAEEQAAEDRGVHGRFVGRFGWRGQTMNLGEFIRGACAVELGLQVKNHLQAEDPSVSPAGQLLPSGETDLTERQCDQMTDFVFNLPTPGRRSAADPGEAASIRRGLQTFESVGCADCHRPTLGSVNGIYSDLLVHDMGLALIDPMPAPLEEPRPKQASPSISSYGGGGSPIMSNAQLAARQDWKTPPLWGLRDSGPYLHDGRAKTVDQAISAHGGEAAWSLEQYQQLTKKERVDLLTFLDMLAAPHPARLPRPTEVKLPLAAR